MKKNIALAAVIAVGAGVVGVGALDRVPDLYGTDELKNLTLQVVSTCTALHTLGDPIAYGGGNPSLGENAMAAVTTTQLIAPMNRPLGIGICNQPQRAAAEGMVIALDGIAVIGNGANVGAEGIDYPGVAQDPANNWRSVLRLIYTGMPISVGTKRSRCVRTSTAQKRVSTARTAMPALAMS